jgi:hypothetical protein
MKIAKLIPPVLLIFSLSLISLSPAEAVDLEVKIFVDRQCKAYIRFINAGTTAINNISVPYNSYFKNTQDSWEKVYGSNKLLTLNPGQETTVPFKPKEGYLVFGKRTLRANADPACAVLNESGAACDNNEQVRTVKCVPKQKLRRKMN